MRRNWKGRWRTRIDSGANYVSIRSGNAIVHEYGSGKETAYSWKIFKAAAWMWRIQILVKSGKA